MVTHRLVEPDDSRHSSLPEVLNIVIRRERLEAIIYTGNVGGARKRQQLACNASSQCSGRVKYGYSV